MKTFIKFVSLTTSFVAAVIAAAMGSAVAGEGGAYTVPDSYTPVNVWSEGISADQARAYRNEYRASDYASGNDRGTFAYLNINEVITSAALSRQGKVAMLEQSTLPRISQTVATTRLGSMPLGEAMADQRSRMQAIAVVHRGKLVFEAYPGMRPRQKHVWNSASKTITGLLVHMLNAEGKLDLQKTAGDYLPQFKDSSLGGITVANFLHHRSGLDILETQANIEDPNHPMGAALAAAVSHRGASGGASVSDVLMSVKPLRADQGLVFDYSSLNTQVLGMIIEELEGKPWNDVASERIWSKIGMENDAIVGLSDTGDILNGGIFASTLLDFARFATALTPSWKAVADAPLVNEQYYSRVLAAADFDAYQTGYQGRRMIDNFGADSPLLGSSYKWDALFADGDMYKAGLGGQGIYVSPETDTAVVWFSSTYRNSLSMAAYARAIVEQNFR